MSETVLQEAQRIVEGARQKDYGTPMENWSATAAIWNVILKKKLTEPLTAEEAAMCMVGVKLARLANGITRDSLVDLPGYARVIEMIIEERTQKPKGAANVISTSD